MKIAAVAGALALALGGPALAQDKPAVSEPFNSSCRAEAVPAGAICRIVGTSTLNSKGAAPNGWALYELVGASGRSGLSVLFRPDGRIGASIPVPAKALDAWTRGPYVVASTVRKGESDYAVMWMRGETRPAGFSVHRIEADGAWTPIDSTGLWSAVETRLNALTGAGCYSIDTDISWRSLGLRYDMMGDNGSCGVAFLQLGVENGAVQVTDALVVRNDVKPKRRPRARRR